MDIDEPVDMENAMEMDDIEMDVSGVMGEGDDLAGLSGNKSQDSEEIKIRNFATDPSKYYISYKHSNRFTTSFQLPLSAHKSRFGTD